MVLVATGHSALWQWQCSGPVSVTKLYWYDNRLLVLVVVVVHCTTGPVRLTQLSRQLYQPLAPYFPMLKTEVVPVWKGGGISHCYWLTGWLCYVSCTVVLWYCGTVLCTGKAGLELKWRHVSIEHRPVVDCRLPRRTLWVRTGSTLYLNWCGSVSFQSRTHHCAKHNENHSNTF